MNSATLYFIGEDAAFPAFIESCRSVNISCADLQIEMVNHLVAMDFSPLALFLAASVILFSYGFGISCGWAASTLQLCLIRQPTRPRPRQGRRQTAPKRKLTSDGGQAVASDDLPLPPLPVLDGAMVETFFRDNDYEAYSPYESE